MTYSTFKTDELTVKTSRLSDIIDVIERHLDCPHTKLWYRGQSNHEHMLLPSIFRQGFDEHNMEGHGFDEAGAFKDFIRRYPNERHSHQNTAQWLSLMQHYGMPTRILDWSTSLAVGTFFAVNHNENIDGALYVMNSSDLYEAKKETPLIPDNDFMVTAQNVHELLTGVIKSILPTILWLNDGKTKQVFFRIMLNNQGKSIRYRTDPVLVRHLQQEMSLRSFISRLRFTLKQQFTHFSIEEMAVLDAEDETAEKFSFHMAQFGTMLPLEIPHLNERIKAQHGVFTWHGGKYIGGVEIIPFYYPEHMPEIRILKIKIPAKGKAKLIEELEYNNITEASLFPDMQQVAQDIKAQHTFRPDEQDPSRQWRVHW